MNLAHFAGLQAYAGIHTLARGELRRPAGAARQLAALAGLELDVVHRAADGDVPKRHCVARLDRRVGARTNLVAGLHALGREDVAALAILVQNQRQMRRTVRVVLQTLDDAGNPVLVTLEIDQPVALLVATADVPRGLPPGMVASSGPVLLGGERFERAALVQVRAVDFDHEARARRGRLHFDECHGRESLTSRAGEVDRLPGDQTHVGLFIAVALAGHILEATRLARLVEQIDAFHLDLEHQFDGLFHFFFGRVVAHAKYVLVRLFGDVRSLFRHVRLNQHGHQSFFIHSPLRDAVRAISVRRPWPGPCRA